MKLVYLIPGLYRPAGMERVLSQKADWLAAHGYEVIIVTTEQKGRPLAFPLDSRIKVVDLGIGYEDNNGHSFIDKVARYPFKQLRHRRGLGRLLKQEHPSVTISLFCNESSFLPRIKDGSVKVLESHFCRFKKLQYGRTGLWRLADKLRYRQDERIAASFDRFVVLTREDAAYWGNNPNMRVIPNPRTFCVDKASNLEHHQAIAVGRYTAQKGFDLLLQAWNAIPHNGWKLRIAGQGEQILESEDIITGISQDVEKELCASSIFLLSSRYEGLPMALLEAQAAGLPSVCFKCKCGPSDIIEDGRDGYLIEEGDIQAFSKALLKLMNDSDLRKRMGSEARIKSENYDIEKIMPLWEQLFKELS